MSAEGSGVLEAIVGLSANSATTGRCERRGAFEFTFASPPLGSSAAKRLNIKARSKMNTSQLKAAVARKGG